MIIGTVQDFLIVKIPRWQWREVCSHWMGSGDNREAILSKKVERRICMHKIRSSGPRTIRQQRVTIAAKIMLLGCIMPFLFTACTNGPGAGGIPPNCQSYGIFPDPGNNITLYDIAMTSPTDGWAVGGITHYETWPTKTVIEHFTQGQWQPIDFSVPGAELQSISMTSATEGWAVGVSDTQKIVLHYTGGQWHSVAIPQQNLAARTFKVRMFSATDGWMLATSAQLSNPRDPPESVLYHYQNNQWVMVALPTPTMIDYWDFVAVGPNDVWVVGDYPQGEKTVLAHDQQGQWSLSPQTFGGTLQYVSAANPSDIWSVGEQSSAIRSLLLHYDGMTWVQVPLPPLFDSDRAGANTIGLSSSGAGWLTGQQSAGNGYDKNFVFIRNQNLWNPITWPYPNVRVDAFTAPPPAETWGVGAIEHIDFCKGNEPILDQGVLVHFQNNQWSEDVLP